MALLAEPRSLDVVAVLVILATILYVRSRQKDRTPLPPSPPGLPFIGHYLSSQEDPLVTFRNWGEKYGIDAITLNMMGTRMIVLNSMKSTKELFERRSSIYSDRVMTPMMDLIGWDWALSFQRYGPDFRDHRKLFRQAIITSNYKEQETEAVRAMVKRMAEVPEKWEWVLRHMAAQLIFGIAYGIHIKTEDDPFVSHVERAMRSLAIAGNPGSFIVDLLPWLNYLPSWFPGLSYRKAAAEWSKDVLSLPHVPLDYVKQNMSNGTIKPCIALSELEQLQGNNSAEAVRHERILRNVLGSMYGAGADTTVSSISTFILAMIQNPHFFRKAQEEIDRVIGPNRLPDFSDQESLPYIEALVQEVFRWKPVAPLAVPHVASEDDIYNGYRIPKGSLVVGNIWAIMQDESIWGPNTIVYNPDRFLNADGTLNPAVPYPDVAFGFGRRICAGKDIATSAVWIAVATIVATLDITKAKDKNGNPIEPSGKFSNGMIIFPESFPCGISYRSSKVEQLIKTHAK